MTNNTTELVFILDRSGSMSGLVSDTIGGFNSLLAKQKAEEGDCFVTTVLFSDRCETVHDRLPLSSVPPMTAHDYIPCGCTALIDAIGETVRHIETIHRYARPEDVPAHTVFVITTDGMENASHTFTASEVRTLVRQKQEESGWEFLFIGANIDAVQTASHIGISPARAANYRADSVGTAVLYDTVSHTVRKMRRNMSVGDWSKTIREDMRREEKK